MSWKPQIFPGWRSPKGGWVITELPVRIPAPIRRAWVNRKPRSNRNGHMAVEEAALFLQFNKVTVTKELLAELQDRADTEWCAQEPSRCPRTAKASGGVLVRQAAAEDVKVVLKAVKASHGAGVVTRRRRSCCGG